MSKLSFRARALDAIKPMPVYLIEEVPDLPDFAAINRAVPQMPTGMEKEEECEHHLQRAISAQQAFGHTGYLVIPTPEVYEVPKDFLQMLYPTTYKHPRQLIHVQPFSMDQDIPDYDMDSEDEKWLNEQASKMDIKPLQFEMMMDRLEKSSGQQVVTLKEAKVLLKEDDDLLIVVYDYWLNKRLKMTHSLIPQVKSEKRDGSTNNNPYVAFRRRTEKMQTRKNRKNDEASYEKMLKLKRDLCRSSALLELIRKREKLKREHLHLTVEIFEKRCQCEDFDGKLLSEVLAMKFPKQPVIPAQKPLLMLNTEPKIPKSRPVKASQKRRTYKRKKTENIQPRSSVHRTDLGFGEVASSDDDGVTPAYGSTDDLHRFASVNRVNQSETNFEKTPSDLEDENDPDGPYAFKRKKGCNYHAPLDRLGNWPWCSKEENGLADKKYRFCLTSIPTDTNVPRCIGFARRRIGRGGRIVFDRAYTPLDDHWSDLNPLSNSLPSVPLNEFLSEVGKSWRWFRVPVNTDSSKRTDQNDSESEEETSRRSTDFTNRFQLNKMPIDLNKNMPSNHKELFQKNKKQLERLKHEESDDSDSSVGIEHSFLSRPTSRFSLDQVRLALPPVITVSDDSSSSNHPSQPIIQLSDSNSITSNFLERIVLANGPLTELPEASVVGTNTVLDRCKDVVITTPIDSISAADFSHAVVHSVNLCSSAVPSTEFGSGSASHSSDNVHVIHPKSFSTAVSQGELRLLSAEQNGTELRLKPDVFLSKVKVDLGAVSMDVT